MRTIYRRFAAAVSAVTLGALLLVIYVQKTIPDRFTLVQGEELKVTSVFDIQTVYKGKSNNPDAYSVAGNSYQLDLRMLGGLNVKTVQVDVVERKTVIPAGTPFGIKMFTKGVIVVGLTDIPCNGVRMNPAKDAGLKLGDIILAIDGVEVTGNKQVGSLVSQSGGSPMRLKAQRGDSVYNLTLQPVQSDNDGLYRAGIWVRDSSAGIGTMTYYDPANGLFTGLGHAICDVDTGEIMPLNKGQIVDVDITGVIRGEEGSPGELHGSFVNDTVTGELWANTQTGVYGRLSAGVLNDEVWNRAVPVAQRYEVRPGEATILTTIDSDTPKEYSICIEKVDISDQSPTKNMVIRVTDPELLAAAGGIVQGMSGSPILQNGMLVGSVTHVFVNDPTRGFGIFAENIYSGANSVYLQLSQAS